MKNPKLDEAREKMRRIQKIARIVLAVLLAFVLIYTCSRWGLRGGLIIGFFGFLFFGGIELLLVTFVSP